VQDICQSRFGVRQHEYYWAYQVADGAKPVQSLSILSSRSFDPFDGDTPPVRDDISSEVYGADVVLTKTSRAVTDSLSSPG